jgi:hypothetical protein
LIALLFGTSCPVTHLGAVSDVGHSGRGGVAAEFTFKEVLEEGRDDGVEVFGVIFTMVNIEI